MKSLTPPILPKVPALRSAASQSCELRLQFFWTSEKEVEIFNNGWGVQNKQRDPLFTSRIPSPASSSLPIPISDLFTQIHLTFVLFVCLEFFYFFTSRIDDFCWLPFIFTLVRIRSVLISYHACFTLLRFYIHRPQSLSLFPNKADQAFSSATFCKLSYVSFSIATFSLSDQSKWNNAGFGSMTHIVAVPLLMSCILVKSEKNKFDLNIRYFVDLF